MVYSTVFDDCRGPNKKFEVVNVLDEDALYQWAIKHEGGFWFFFDLYAALCYAAGRGFIDFDEIRALVEKISDKAHSC